MALCGQKETLIMSLALEEGAHNGPHGLQSAESNNSSRSCAGKHFAREAVGSGHLLFASTDLFLVALDFHSLSISCIRIHPLLRRRGEESRD